MGRARQAALLSQPTSRATAVPTASHATPTLSAVCGPEWSPADLKIFRFLDHHHFPVAPSALFLAYRPDQLLPALTRSLADAKLPRAKQVRIGKAHRWRSTRGLPARAAGWRLRLGPGGTALAAAQRLCYAACLCRRHQGALDLFAAHWATWGPLGAPQLRCDWRGSARRARIAARPCLASQPEAPSRFQRHQGQRPPSQPSPSHPPRNSRSPSQSSWAKSNRSWLLRLAPLLEDRTPELRRRAVELMEGLVACSWAREPIAYVAYQHNTNAADTVRRGASRLTTCLQRGATCVDTALPGKQARRAACSMGPGGLRRALRTSGVRAAVRQGAALTPSSHDAWQAALRRFLASQQGGAGLSLGASAPPPAGALFAPRPPSLAVSGQPPAATSDSRPQLPSASAPAPLPPALGAVTGAMDAAVAALEGLRLAPLHTAARGEELGLPPSSRSASARASAPGGGGLLGQEDLRPAASESLGLSRGVGEREGTPPVRGQPLARTCVVQTGVEPHARDGSREGAPGHGPDVGDALGHQAILHAQWALPRSLGCTWTQPRLCPPTPSRRLPSIASRRARHGSRAAGRPAVIRQLQRPHPAPAAHRRVNAWGLEAGGAADVAARSSWRGPRAGHSAAGGTGWGWVMVAHRSCTPCTANVCKAASLAHLFVCRRAARPAIHTCARADAWLAVHRAHHDAPSAQVTPRHRSHLGTGHTSAQVTPRHRSHLGTGRRVCPHSRLMHARVVRCVPRSVRQYGPFRAPVISLLANYTVKCAYNAYPTRIRQRARSPASVLRFVPLPFPQVPQDLGSQCKLLQVRRTPLAHTDRPTTARHAAPSHSISPAAALQPLFKLTENHRVCKSLRSRPRTGPAGQGSLCSRRGARAAPQPRGLPARFAGAPWRRIGRGGWAVPARGVVPRISPGQERGAAGWKGSACAWVAVRARMWLAMEWERLCLCCCARARMWLAGCGVVSHERQCQGRGVAWTGRDPHPPPVGAQRSGAPGAPWLCRGLHARVRVCVRVCARVRAARDLCGRVFAPAVRGRAERLGGSPIRARAPPSGHPAQVAAHPPGEIRTTRASV